VTEGAAPDLTVRLGPLTLSNPVMNASGTFGYGHEWPELTMTRALGAIVTKTLTLAPRPGNPPPRLHETPAGLLNTIGLQNVGVDAFLAEHLPRLRGLGPRVIVSVGGNAADEFAAALRRLESGEIDAYEINISCPNVAHGGLAFGRSAQTAAEVVRAVRCETRRPLFVKLSPNVTDIVEIGKACLDAGADGLTAVNTFLGLAIDIDRERPVFHRGGAGLSGPAIRPLALHKVWELARGLRCPLIGAGGIETARDAWEFMLAGAGAVQVGTAQMHDPTRAASLAQGLSALCRERGIARIADLVGRLQPPAAARKTQP
jgi:dihydroorotate dehydrogenase (NAD+) catalytic subunit